MPPIITHTSSPIAREEDRQERPPKGERLPRDQPASETEVPGPEPGGEEGDFFEGGGAGEARVGEGEGGVQGGGVNLVADIEGEGEEGGKAGKGRRRGGGHCFLWRGYRGWGGSGVGKGNVS